MIFLYQKRRPLRSVAFVFACLSGWWELLIWCQQYDSCLDWILFLTWIVNLRHLAVEMASTGWLKGRVKAVPSGDSLVIMGSSKAEIPPEKSITLGSLMAPRLVWHTLINLAFFFYHPYLQIAPIFVSLFSLLIIVFSWRHVVVEWMSHLHGKAETSWGSFALERCPCIDHSNLYIYLFIFFF